MPTTTELQRREADLVEQINAHNRAYYVENKPTITDLEFDALLRELQQLEKALGRALPGSPTQRVGSDITGNFPKVKHTRPMLSLDNVFSVDETQAFLGGNDSVVVEPKIDGLSLDLRYEDGQLVQALTRGDSASNLGEDVTANARTVRTIPLAVRSDFSGHVRGEVYMRRSTFTELNELRAAAGDEPFANPRNAASGSMKQRSPKIVAERNLDFMAYETFGATAAVNHRLNLAFLAELGFQTPAVAPLLAGGTIDLVTVTIAGQTAILRSAINMVEAARAKLDFDIDGAVVKINGLVRREELGLKAKSPRWACAYKFKAERVMTRLDDIEITIGRTGQVTPNAVLRPVALGGVTVSAASLMNVDELARIGNPAVGDTVVIERSAEVIPRVVGLVVRSGNAPWTMPKTCPHCQTELVRNGVHYFDPNPKCPERVYGQLRHATAKGALDWDGLGEVTLRQAIKMGEVTKLSDLFTCNLAWMTTAASNKFFAERERVKTQPLWRKLAALGIEDVGQTSSKELAAKYRSILAISAAPTAELEALLGPVATASLQKFLVDNADEIDRLDSLGLRFEEAGVAGALSGKTFVITGTLFTGSRDQVSAKIEAAGGMVKGSVSKTTDYLVCGEAPGGNKTAGAKKHGTKVITEEELYALLGQPYVGADASETEDNEV